MRTDGQTGRQADRLTDSHEKLIVAYGSFASVIQEIVTAYQGYGLLESEAVCVFSTVTAKKARVVSFVFT